MYRVRPIFQNDHFGKYSNSPKMANFRRVLKFDKFAGEWPLLRYVTKCTFYFTAFDILSNFKISKMKSGFHNFYLMLRPPMPLPSN
jgi:hypothetical protein